MICCWVACLIRMASEFQHSPPFRGRTRLAIRGDARSQYRRCDICGRHVYSPMGKPYVLSKTPRDVMICESQLQGFIVREITMRRVNSKSWRELSIQKLSIL